MSDTADILAALIQRERDLEMDAIAVRSRIEEVREMRAILEQPQRRRRRKPELVEPPLRVEDGSGGMLPPDTEDSVA
jgi:hypothetical protein